MLKKSLDVIKQAQKPEDALVAKANSLLKASVSKYNSALIESKDELVSEFHLNPEYIYSVTNIKALAITYRLSFISGKRLKTQLPEIITFKIEHYNLTQQKRISNVYLLTHAEHLKDLSNPRETLVFIKTEQGQYFLIHAWGKPYSKLRHWLSWPLKSGECFAASIFVGTMAVALALPTAWITLDTEATYWSGYRLGTFFHLLIFNSGFAVFSWLAFTRGFTKSNWDNYLNR
jgi:hypothetical protein